MRLFPPSLRPSITALSMWVPTTIICTRSTIIRGPRSGRCPREDPFSHQPSSPLVPLTLGPGMASSTRSLPRRRQRPRSEEHTSELQSPCNLVCRLLLEKKKYIIHHLTYDILP